MEAQPHLLAAGLPHQPSANLVAEILLEPIMAEAAAACESRAVLIDSVIAGMRSRYDCLREHGARGEREKRQSCDYGLHFRSPSVNRKAEHSCGACWSGDGEDELLQNVSREARLKKLKNIPELDRQTSRHIEE